MEKILTFEPVFYQEEKVLEYDIEDDVLMMGNPCRMGQLIKAGEDRPQQGQAVGVQPGRTHT